MAADLKWNILQPGQMTEYSRKAVWLQASDFQIIFQVATFRAYHLGIQGRSNLSTLRGQDRLPCWVCVNTELEELSGPCSIQASGSTSYCRSPELHSMNPAPTDISMWVSPELLTLFHVQNWATLRWPTSVNWKYRYHILSHPQQHFNLCLWELHI